MGTDATRFSVRSSLAQDTGFFLHLSKKLIWPKESNQKMPFGVIPDGIDILYFSFWASNNQSISDSFGATAISGQV
jgi:hypothetical protein